MALGLSKGLSALSITVGSSLYQSALAATFSQASLQAAQQQCKDFSLPNPEEEDPGSAGLLPNNVCAAATGGNPTSTSIGGFVAPTSSIAVQERLRTARRSDNDLTGGGASPDVIDLSDGLSVFVSAGAEQLNHHNNKFEDGYESQIPTVTAGADYQITPWLIGGLAFNYFNFSGSYDDGGNFNTNSYGPIAYISVLPFEHAFADFTLGYARKDYYRNRRGFIVSSDGSAGGKQQGGTEGNELSTALLLGYDHPIGNITIGPRLGIDYIQAWINDYREHGDTGLELRYSGQDRSTLQSSLGAVATIAISTTMGVVVPQLGANWVHDYAIGGRTTNASFVADSSGSEFSFKSEQVASDFAVINLGVSASLPNNLQPFVNFQTVQGNENLVSYGGAIGLRFGL